MLIEIFTSIVRGLLTANGGTMARADLLDEVAVELEESALADAPRARIEEVVQQVAVAGPVIAVGDELVDLAVVADHVGFTHRLSAEELDADRLELDADLPLVARLADADGGLHLADAVPLRFEVDHALPPGPGGIHQRARRLQGPPGWLAPFAAGQLVVASASEGTLSLRPLADDEPEPGADAGAELGVRLRDDLHATIRVTNEGDGSPVTTDELQAAGLVAGWFEPGPDRPPFGDLLEAAGLERCGELVAPPDRWAPHAELAEEVLVLARHVDHLDEAETRALLEVVRALRAWRTDPTRAPARSVLAPLHRMPEAALCLEEELLRADPEGTDLAAFLDAFERPGGAVAAVLDTLRALAADRAGRTADAEEALAAARVAAPDWFPATESLAHLLEVRGQTQEAVNLLQTTRSASDDELQILRLRSRLSSPAAGRNDPCPCGSGRKYKQCHLGQTLMPPEVQVSWLLDKARSHTNRFGPFEVTDRLPSRTDLHEDAELMAADVALFAYGCLEAFLDARRHLLPPDEVALAQAWIDGNRPGLYRVVGGDYGDRTSDAADGETVVLVDLATDEAFQVQGTSLFDGRGLADVVWCRLLPDGERWWTSGFARGVEPDEVDVLAATTDGDPLDLLRALQGSPVSVRVDASDGTPRATGTASWAVGTDRSAVEEVLDREAHRHADHWTLDDEHGLGLRLVVVDPMDLSDLDPELLETIEELGDPQVKAHADELVQHAVLVRTDSLPRHARGLELVPSWLPHATLKFEQVLPIARHRATEREEELMMALYATSPLDD